MTSPLQQYIAYILDNDNGYQADGFSIFRSSPLKSTASEKTKKRLRYITLRDGNGQMSIAHPPLPPQLKTDKRPQLLTIIRATFEVVGQQALHRQRLKNALAPQRVG